MWNEIVGHNQPKEQIKRAILSQNIPHAYLFTGIDGIGKRGLAKNIAKTMLCENPSSEMEACLVCPNCKKLDLESHPDFIEIIPDKPQITIDTIRNIKDALKFSPYEAKRRVIIIDQAELMNANAANAALKILEEPPAGNHFFLITSTPSRLLPTIISRCQRIDFSPLNNKEIENYLISKHNFEKDQAYQASIMSGGSIGHALSITPELIDSVTEDLLNLLSRPNASMIIELSSKWSTDTDNLQNIVYIIHRWFHNALIEKTTSKAEETPITEIIKNKNNSSRLMEKCNEINKLYYQTLKTYNKQLMFEQLLFSLAAK